MALPKPRAEVRWFAGWMEQKLQDNDDKGGWECCDDSYLVRRIADERNELSRLLKRLQRKLDRDEEPTYEEVQRVFSEAADVANFAMMLADNWRPNLPERGPKRNQ